MSDGLKVVIAIFGVIFFTLFMTALGVVFSYITLRWGWCIMPDPSKVNWFVVAGIATLQAFIILGGEVLKLAFKD